MLNFYLLYSDQDYRILNLQNIVEYNHVLDYNIVKNKLTKVDYMKKTPSDSVVSFYMFKKLSNIIKENDETSILYILKSFSPEVLENITSVVKDLCKHYSKDYNFEVIQNTKAEINEKISHKFNIIDLND